MRAQEKANLVTMQSHRLVPSRNLVAIYVFLGWENMLRTWTSPLTPKTLK